MVRANDTDVAIILLANISGLDYNNTREFINNKTLTRQWRIQKPRLAYTHF